ncbi:molybdopterin binding oxidoreductase [Gonapodya prolifera JEL478]|uniref:Nitrate reductase [NADPH] n=1 Tax=Gonapodya prolifera (strain JEL478) TaxID=1344416 RepID=A0A139A279_GONPJ|nr:molybdopterin binding oxidoreductase [Gonapodya prolifera JEL478]|eukprot:KXS10851.1 molybdopterin binding oxidoreductase [Gonapodya prolifera JEL478]
MSIIPLIASLSLTDAPATSQPVWAIAATLGALSGVAGATLIAAITSAGNGKRNDTLTKGKESQALELPSELRQWNGDVDKRDGDTPVGHLAFFLSQHSVNVVLLTQDNWIPRHPDMVRLTGRHPFNSEAPITSLMEAAEQHNGLTPNALHYVRNHGPVPNLEWSEFKVSFDGLVRNPRTFTMDEIASMPKSTFQVTLTCAGNRRHEQNVTKNSQGFSWGPAAVSTAVWSGVPLSYVLELCGGVKSAKREDGTVAEPRFVNFAGAETLPKGYYGTTVPVEMALDYTSDILLAYEMNGEQLPPDHGYPLRVIIPGWIGGRMVKWLSKVTVSESESDSTYHFEDNRVLPPNVTSAAVALTTTQIPNSKGGTSKFIINERNINSVITTPSHGTPCDVKKTGSSPTTVRLPVKGYAYTGGGRRIIRVELSVDNGQTWHLVPSVRHGSTDGAPRHGTRFWCWFLWETEVEVPVKENPDADSVSEVGEVLVRCWDASQNTQPREQTWNLLGMMSNNWYRVKLFFDPATSTYTWQHPTNISKSKEDGWMPREKALSSPTPTVAAEPAKSKATLKEGLKPMTMAEVALHKSETDCYIVIDALVLDCTKFLKRHPGGAKSIMIVAGQDATEDFRAIHGNAAKAMKDKFAVGYIAS